MTAISESVLIESKAARNNQLVYVSHERAKEVLDKAKALVHFAQVGSQELATVEQIAEFYEIPEGTVKTVFRDHRNEFLSDGTKSFKGKELRDVRAIIALASQTSQATLWTPRGALRLGMLLRDSEIAKAVRTALLNEVERAGHLDQQVQSQQYEIEKLRLELQVAQAKQKLTDTRNTIIATNSPETAAMILGVERIEHEKIIEHTVIQNERGRIIAQFDGAGITEIACRYGFPKGKKGNDQCRAWLASIGITQEHWLEEPTAHVTKKLPRDLLQWVDEQWKSGKGMRQKGVGEYVSLSLLPGKF
ncbi:MAG: DNA-binding protein [Cyanobacteria bacterium P01_A01_bin.17]